MEVATALPLENMHALEEGKLEEIAATVSASYSDSVALAIQEGNIEEEWMLINQAAERTLLLACGLPPNSSEHIGRGRCPTFVQENIVTLSASKSGAKTHVMRQVDKLKNQLRNFCALSSRGAKQGYSNYDCTQRSQKN